MPYLNMASFVGQVDSVVRLIKAVGRWCVPVLLFQAAADLSLVVLTKARKMGEEGTCISVT